MILILLQATTRCAKHASDYELQKNCLGVKELKPKTLYNLYHGNSGLQKMTFLIFASIKTKKQTISIVDKTEKNSAIACYVFSRGKKKKLLLGEYLNNGALAN